MWLAPTVRWHPYSPLRVDINSTTFFNSQSTGVSISPLAKVTHHRFRHGHMTPRVTTLIPAPSRDTLVSAPRGFRDCHRGVEDTPQDTEPDPDSSTDEHSRGQTRSQGKTTWPVTTKSQVIRTENEDARQAAPFPWPPASTRPRAPGQQRDSGPRSLIWGVSR